MRRSVALVALAALAATGAALAMVVPGGDPEPSTPVLGAGPVVSTGPVEEAAQRAAARRHLEADLAALVAAGPAASCLVVAHGDETLFTHQTDRPLVPASATKLLTAVAAAHAGAGEPHDVVRMLKDSDNDAADRILAALGRQGMERALAEAGVPLAGVALVDGSGLDRGNRATCGALHATVAEENLLPAVMAGLAVAGRDGTLRDRFAGTGLEGRLRAKTGSIRGVAALVGLVETGGGARVTFAHVVNDVPSAAAGVALQDDLAMALARFVTEVES